MNIADVLSGHAELKGIQWVLLSATARRVLAGQLRALLPAGAIVGPCQPREVRFKPGRRLTAYYDALIRTKGTHTYRVRPIAITWGSDGDADPRVGEVDLAKMQAEAARHGVATPFLQLMADSPEWNMHVQVSPLDARFIQLVRLSDPRHVCATLADAYASRNAALDQHGISEYTVTPIKYRPSKCHVLRYDPVDPAKGETVFAKLYIGEEVRRTFRREDGARAFRVATEVADWLAEHGEGVNCLRPLAYMAEDAVVLYPRVSGVPLSDYAERVSCGVARWLRHAGAALCTLHHLPVALAGRLGFHDFAAEIRSIVGKSSHIPLLLPQVGSAMDALFDRARELHDLMPQESPTFTHGDLKSEHIWVTAGGVTVMDFDSSRPADPALDMGRFLADWQFRHPANDQAGLEEAHKSFLAGYAAGAPKERLIRARLYQAIELVNCAVRRVQLFEPDWASRTAWLVACAQAVINDLQLTLGLSGQQLFLHRSTRRSWHHPAARRGGR